MARASCLKIDQIPEQSRLPTEGCSWGSCGEGLVGGSAWCWGQQTSYLIGRGWHVLGTVATLQWGQSLSFLTPAGTRYKSQAGLSEPRSGEMLRAVTKSQVEWPEESWLVLGASSQSHWGATKPDELGWPGPPPAQLQLCWLNTSSPGRGELTLCPGHLTGERILLLFSPISKNSKVLSCFYKELIRCLEKSCSKKKKCFHCAVPKLSRSFNGFLGNLFRTESGWAVRLTARGAAEFQMAEQWACETHPQKKKMFDKWSVFILWWRTRRNIRQVNRPAKHESSWLTGSAPAPPAQEDPASIFTEKQLLKLPFADFSLLIIITTCRLRRAKGRLGFASRGKCETTLLEPNRSEGSWRV